MSLFRQLPLQRKLALAMIITAIAALLVTSAALLTYGFSCARTATVERTLALADVVAAASAHDMVARDQRAAEGHLSALKKQGWILSAALYTPDGRRFAQYTARPHSLCPPEGPQEPDGCRFQNGQLVVFHPVLLPTGERTGTLCLHMDLAELYGRLFRGGWITATVLVLALLTAFLVSCSLRRAIASPILELARFTRQVTDQKDYTLRAKPRDGEEINQLAEGLNQMLVAIQERNQQLQSAADSRARRGEALQRELNRRIQAEEELKKTLAEVEQQVRDRTAALQANNEELRAEIARRMKVTSALQQAETRFGALIERSADVIALVNPGGMVLYTSPAVERVLGYAPVEMIGLNALKLLHPDDAQRARDQLQELNSAAGSTLSDRFRLRHKDGSWRWIEMTGANLLDEPSVQALVINYRDITRHMEADRALRDSEERYRSLAEAAHDMIFIIGRDDRVQYVNGFAASFLGTTPDRIIGKTRGELFPPDQAQRQSENLEKVFNTAMPLYVEHPISLQARVLWIGTWLTPLRDGAGDVRAVLGISRDITQRIQSERELRDSYALLRSVVDGIPDPLFLKGLDGRYILVNTALARTLGFSAEEMVGKTAADVVSAAVAAEVALHDREVIASGTPHVYEESTVVAGRLRTFLTCRAPLRDPSGTIIGLIGAARDITERKQAETALRESEERFRTFTEQTLVGVYVIQGGQFRYVNAALAAMFGYEIGELLGKKAPLDLVHPEDAAWLKESMQRRLVGQEEAAHHVWRGVRKDGSLIYCEVLGRAIEYEGQPALMGNVLNITEQKQAEQALQESERLHRLLTEEATDLISREAPDGAVLYVTPSCRRLLGFDPVDLIGMHGPDFIHPDDRERVVNLIDEHAAKGVDTCGVQHRLRRKDGSYVWVETNGRLLRNEKGELAEIHCVTRDITDRKEAEAALARSEQLHRASVEAAGAVPYCRDYTADRYVFVGVGMEALTGCRREEFTARVWDDMVQEVVPTGAFAGLAYAEAMKKFRTERQLAWTADYRIRTRQGEERWVGCAAVDTRDDQGNSLVSIGLFMDITERKRAEEALRESEQKYRLLHDSMMDAFVQTSMDGRIREFNRAYREMLGYTGDELRSLTYMDLTPSKWHEMEARIVREQIIPQGHSDVYEKEYKKKDGTVFPVELRVFLIRNSQGQPASMWAIVRDISDRKKVENLLRQAREDLERRVAERTTELARANEALKKEIAEREHAEDALRSLSGRLLQLQDEERRRLARELHDATAQSLAVLAMNLTAIGKQSSRLDSGVRRMINESMSLAEQCSHEIRTTSYLLHPPLLDEFGLATALQWFADGFTQRSSVKVELDVAANVGRMPREIETTLFRIVQEGLSNIHRHSGSPVARIRVSRDANQVTLVVQDEGRGMPPAAPGDSKARIGRLGVGIIGMRERVRQLHGRLEIHSSAKGTVITVALPVGDTSS